MNYLVPFVIGFIVAVLAIHLKNKWMLRKGIGVRISVTPLIPTTRIKVGIIGK